MDEDLNPCSLTLSLMLFTVTSFWKAEFYLGKAKLTDTKSKAKLCGGFISSGQEIDPHGLEDLKEDVFGKLCSCEVYVEVQSVKETYMELL